MKNVFTVNKDDEDGFEIVIGSNTTGIDIEQGLALLVQALANREKTLNPEFKELTLIRSIETWLRLLDDNQ